MVVNKILHNISVNRTFGPSCMVGDMLALFSGKVEWAASTPNVLMMETL